MASPICWSRLLAVGSKEAEPYRKVDLSTPQTLIGRKDGCHEKISDNTVSSVHCRITLVQLSDEVLLDEDHQSALEVWLEDTSANGTYVNMQKVGKGNRVRLSQNDEIGLIRPCGGGERPPWAFIFQDFSADLSAAEIHAVFHGGGAPTAAVAAAVPAAAEVTPRDAHSVPATPRVDAPPVLPLAAPPAPAGAGAARPLQPLGAGVKFEHSAALANPLMSSMRILAAPDPKGLRELRGTMRRGALNMGEFISADGPSALLDVISEVVAKPKLGWIDLEVLDGALGTLNELMNTPDGANSVLTMEGALDALVSVLTLGEVRVLGKALHILSCLVVCSAKPLVETALRRVNRYGGASVGLLLCDLLRREIEASTACEVVTLMNTLVACSPNSEALLSEIADARLDDAIAAIEPLLASSAELRTQIDVLVASRQKAESPKGAEEEEAEAASAPPGGGRIPIDEGELRTLFTVKEKASSRALLGGGKSEPATPRGGAGKRVMLLDLKRSNQIQIALAKFKRSHEELRDCVLRLDESVIKAEDVQKLRSCAPTAEELELLAPYLPGGEQHGAMSSLESADLFLAYMSQVPRLIPRLDCFHTKMTLPTRISDAAAQIDALTAATRAVREATVLPQLLALVLAAGNVLNAGTLKGGAKGFRLEVLQKLPETKTSAVEPQTSLLHHLAALAVRHTADVAKALKSELRRVEEAASIKLAVVDAEVSAFRRELDAVGREVPLVEKAGQHDCFHEAMRAFASGVGADLDALDARAASMRESLVSLARFLGEESAAEEPEMVLHRIHAFVTSFGKACRDNERAAFLKKKQEEIEAERARKTEADAKATAAAGGGESAPRKPQMRKVLTSPGLMMSSIQGSLRRGEFKSMKALQAQMSEELASRMRERRSSLTGGANDESL